MAVLPNDPFSLNTIVSVEDEPGLTWFIDKESKRITGTVDGYDAVRQAVEIILRTDRYRWQIYRPSSGVEYDLVGLDAGYVAAELQRRIKDALMMDARVISISDYSFVVNGSILAISFTVNTVYGPLAEELEVSLD